MERWHASEGLQSSALSCITGAGFGTTTQPETWTKAGGIAAAHRAKRGRTLASRTSPCSTRTRADAHQSKARQEAISCLLILYFAVCMHEMSLGCSRCPHIHIRVTIMVMHTHLSQGRSLLYAERSHRPQLHAHGAWPHRPRAVRRRLPGARGRRPWLQIPAAHGADAQGRAGRASAEGGGGGAGGALAARARPVPRRRRGRDRLSLQRAAPAQPAGTSLFSSSTANMM